MAGRISEYLDAGKLTGDELVDFSVVDAGSPTGYSTRKKTLADVAEFNPTLYSASSDLLGNRTVNQDGNTLFFNDGDFGLDFGNDGFIYEDLTRRVGIGTDTPLASTHIKGQSGDDLLLIENSLGNDRFIMNEDGQTGSGVGINASILSSFGHFNQVNNKSFGWGFYPQNCTGAGFTIQMKGTTTKGFTIATQGGKTGSVKGVESVILSTGNTEAIGVEGSARNGSTINIGVKGLFTGGASVIPSNYGVGVEGLANSDINSEQYGVVGRAQFNNTNINYTNDLVGVFGTASGNNADTSTSSNIIGGKFLVNSTITTGDKISLLVPSTDNDGVICFGQDSRQGDSILQTTGGVRMQGLPTSSAGLATGELYNDAGTLKIA